MYMPFNAESFVNQLYSKEFISSNFKESNCRRLFSPFDTIPEIKSFVKSNIRIY